ncbi:MAG TPA: polyprenyl synthetase family protein [Caldithrix sp.]|nr:polyprenyl synthetase family protein [Caldithrix sp.]
MSEDLKSYLLKIKNEVDIEIEKFLSNENSLTEGLFKSAAYSTSGGKRIRAVFIYLMAETLFGVDNEKILLPACSIELIHAASLIMDDLPFMDNSQLRRGKPANHVVFGADVALLACIGILSRATQIILKSDKLQGAEKLEIVSILSRAYGFDGLASGQFVDLKLKDKNIDFNIIRFINQKKTAALFSASSEIAAVIGGATKNEKQALVDFANNVGFVFQIIDDLLDIAGDEKTVGKNLKRDEMNFVKLVGVDKAKLYIKEYQLKAEKSLDIFGDKAQTLLAFGRYLIERAA